MSERALRGTRLGATSYETDSGIDLAPRQDVEYACPSGHRFQMPFSVEAEVPMVWECRVCGAQALRVGGVAEEDKPVKPARTHWDMLLERRSIPELEEVLAERLEVLRGGGIGSAFGARSARSARRTPPVNLSTGAPEPDAKPAAHTEAAKGGSGNASGGDGSASGTGGTGGGSAAKSAEPDGDGAAKASTRTAAKKAPAKKTTAGTAPAKKTAASRTAAKTVKKTAAKKPSAK